MHAEFRSSLYVRAVGTYLFVLYRYHTRTAVRLVIDPGVAFER